MLKKFNEYRNSATGDNQASGSANFIGSSQLKDGENVDVDGEIEDGDDAVIVPVSFSGDRGKTGDKKPRTTTMKLKKFSKFESKKYPQYRKGTIVIFPTRSSKELSEDFVSDIADKLGYEYDGSIPGGFVIKTPIGQEEQAGRDFVENYPEFFDSYEREDLRLDYYWKMRDELVSDIKELVDDYAGKTFIDEREFNSRIDSIILKLKDLKIK